MADVDIFLMESYASSHFAIGSYLLFFVVVCGLEYRFQTTAKPFLAVVYLNAIYVVFLWQVLTISEFVLGWRSEWLGGEVPSMVLLPAAAFSVLFLAKRLALDHAGVRFNSPNFICAFPLLVPFVPVLLLLVYVFALGSNWRN